MFSFTSKGEFGRWFNGDNNVSFTGDLTVLELEELRSVPALQTVVLLLLLYQITQTMYAPESEMAGGTLRQTIIIIDEAWQMLNRGDVGEFMEQAYRRCRKRNGSIGLITQGIQDLYQNERLGEALLANSQWFFLLAQKHESIIALQKSGKLALNEGGISMLKTVHTRKGQYSEVFVYTTINGSAAAGIGRLVVTRFWQLLYTTDPREKNLIAERENAGMSLIEAINDVIRFEEERA